MTKAFIALHENFDAVAIVLYEALRQQHFAGLQDAGELHHTRVSDGWRDYLGPKQEK